MSTKLNKVEAIKAFIEAPDRYAAGGGRQVKMEDYKGEKGVMSADAKKELADLAIAALNADPKTYGNASPKGPGPYELE